jgi:hypothetical protein
MFDKIIYKLVQCTFVVKEFYSAGSVVQVRNSFHREIYCTEGEIRSVINRNFWSNFPRQYSDMCTLLGDP